MSGSDPADDGFDGAPTSRDALYYSLSTLLHNYGRTDSALLGVAINGLFVITFGLLALLTSGVVSWLAFSVAGLCAVPILKEVLRL